MPGEKLLAVNIGMQLGRLLSIPYHLESKPVCTQYDSHLARLLSGNLPKGQRRKDAELKGSSQHGYQVTRILRRKADAAGTLDEA